MSKGFKLATLAGALSLAMSANVSAAVAFQYDGWTVDNGDIDETSGGMCASTLYSCSVVASGKGFKQINVTEVADASSGTSYIMTIVTDQTAGAAGGTGAADLGFSDVSFVQMKLTLGGSADTGESGITARQSIKDGTGTGKTFVSTSDIKTGWANDATSNIVITQQLEDDGGTDYAGDNFSSGFAYRSNNDATTGERTGFEMSIDQVARLASAAVDPVDGTLPHASVDDVQVFALREKQGDKLNSSGSIDLDAADANAAVTWTGHDATAGGLPGDDIKAIWIGQEINLGTSTDRNNGSLGSSFGYVSFEATDTLADGTAGTVLKDSAFGFSETNSGSAWVWDPAFYVNSGKTDPNNLDPVTGKPLPILDTTPVLPADTVL